MEELAGVVETLQQKESSLLATIDTHKAKVKEAESQLKRIRGALKELGVKSESKSKPKGRSPSKAIVSGAIREVLTEDGPQAERALKKAVQAKLKEHGYNSMGFALRFKKALKTDLFRIDGGTISITEESDSLADDDAPVKA